MKPWLDRLSPYRWQLWWGFTLIWTVALLWPQEEKNPRTWNWEDEVRFWVAKTIHVFAYAFYAALSGWLKVPLPWRPALMFALMAHAGLTELGQKYCVPGRTGMLEDVIRNDLGIAIGYLLSWRWWAQSQCGNPKT